MPYHRSKLAKKILLVIAAGTMIPAAFVLPNLPKAMGPLLRKLQESFDARSDSIRKSIQSLKRQRLVEIRERGERTVLVLSESGKKRVLSYKLDEISIKKPRRWDGFWRLIIFDIPETKRKTRDSLRAKLRELNFYQLQKSCFVYPYDCKNEIDFITEILGISEYVNFVMTKSIEDQDAILDYYDM